MTNLNKRFLRHLAIAILFKLTVLIGLWCVFVRDSRVDVDADAVVNRFGASIQTQGENK